MSETRNARGSVENIRNPAGRRRSVRGIARGGARTAEPAVSRRPGRAPGMSGFCPRMSMNVYECLRSIPPGWRDMLTDVYRC